MTTYVFSLMQNVGAGSSFWGHTVPDYSPTVHALLDGDTWHDVVAADGHSYGGSFHDNVTDGALATAICSAYDTNSPCPCGCGLGDTTPWPN